MAPKSNKALAVEKLRTTETYILTQFNYFYDSEDFRQWKDRQEKGDSLYIGQLNSLFPDENALPEISLVENKFKNALHDISRLASEGKGAVKFVAEGNKDVDMRRQQLRESINEGYWLFNKMHRTERQLFLDLAGGSMMAVAVYYNEDSPYPQLNRLNPRFCWPDVRNGKLQTMLTAEMVLERQVARQFPHLGLNDDPANPKDCYFVCLYDDENVYEAVLFANEKNAYNTAAITKTFNHGLGCVPVGFEMLDTFDGRFHGLFEQLSGPLMVRNKTVRFMVDYLEQMSHSPLEERGIENATDEPGPLTVYHHDLTVRDGSTFIRRVPPAAPAGTVFGLLQYMQDQEEKEAIQPPARAGNVSQSIASGSFVDRTQGQLTSVVKELQDKMASLREQVNEICMKMEEKHMDSSKPLFRPVAGKKAYTPTEDINGWYYHEVKYGAGAGLDRLNADARVQNHLAARLISREEARAEIDYLDDSASSQDKIDRENLADALLQRFVRDPATPLSAMARTWLAMKQDGLALEEALEQVVPDIIQAEQAQQQQAAGLPAGAPGEVPPEGAPGAPSGVGETPAELGEVTLPFPPLQQLFGPVR